MRIYGKDIHRFTLSSELVLSIEGEWSRRSNKDQDEIILYPGQFQLESIFIPDDGEVAFNYVDEQANDIKPEFTMEDLLNLEKEGDLKFNKEVRQ